MGLTVAQRSQDHPLTSSTNLYLADTLGRFIRIIGLSQPRGWVVDLAGLGKGGGR